MSTIFDNRGGCLKRGKQSLACDFLQSTHCGSKNVEIITMLIVIIVCSVYH